MSSPSLPMSESNLSKTTSMDVASVRAAFPALQQSIHGRPLVYLDSAATTLKPQAVIDALLSHYAVDTANVHRGVHTLSQRATDAYEEARETVRRFINAAALEECIFVRGTTEAINLVAQSWGPANLKPGEEILVTAMEHHANIVPWQMLCERTGAVLKVAPMGDDGALLVDDFDALLTERTALVAAAWISNALGTINPVQHIVDAAHSVGALVLLDGAQAAPHCPVDVQALGCDFFAFSGHKVYGPTGIGVLWGRRELLEALPPWQGGGDMILSVTFEETTYNRLPARLEAGTPHIAGAIGLGAALQWIEGIGIEAIAAHEAQLLAYGTGLLKGIPEVRLIGTAPRKAGVLGFVIDQCEFPVHPHDVGSGLDACAVAVRAGHHCAQPVMERFGIPATTRASLAAYNTRADLDRLAEAIEYVLRIWKVRG